MNWIFVSCVPVCLDVCRYHLFGDTANYAMLMESNGVPDMIHVSEEAYEKLNKRQEERLAAVGALCIATDSLVPRVPTL